MELSIKSDAKNGKQNQKWFLEVKKNIFNEGEEMKSLNMGAGNQCFSIDFLGGFIEVTS